MRKPWRVLIVGVVLLAGAASVKAHDLKVLASHLLLPKPGERTTVYLSWGHALPVDDLVEGDSVERYEVLLPSGKTLPLKKAADRSLQADVVEVPEAGVAQAVASRKPSVITFVIDKEGNRVMKRGPRSAVKEGKIDQSLRSQQFTKALIVTGEAKGESVKPLGLPLEIVPLDGPSAWRAGGALRFQVLFQGKPVPQEKVQATYVGFRPETDYAVTTTTDAKGIATVRPGQAGTWVLRVQVRQPTTGATREQYDYEACTSTLALEIRP